MRIKSGLNLQDMSSKSRIVMAALQKKIGRGQFMTYLCTKFHTPSSNSPWVIAIKPKYKKAFRTVNMMFYIEIILMKGAHFFSRSIELSYIRSGSHI
jgi:hypothetical protein